MLEGRLVDDAEPEYAPFIPRERNNSVEFVYTGSRIRVKEVYRGSVRAKTFLQLGITLLRADCYDN